MSVGGIASFEARQPQERQGRRAHHGADCRARHHGGQAEPPGRELVPAGGGQDVAIPFLVPNDQPAPLDRAGEGQILEFRAGEILNVAARREMPQHRIGFRCALGSHLRGSHKGRTNPMVRLDGHPRYYP